MARWLNLPAYVVLVSSLLLTGVAWYFARENSRLQNESRFAVRITEVTETVQQRMEASIHALRQARGVFDVKRNLSRSDFRKYVDRMSVGDHFPGMLGIGYAVRLNRSALHFHTASVREEMPAYRVWPGFERSEYFPIVYIEPFDWRNQRSLGYDMFTEPTQRRAMERARDSGEAALSATVTLTQETDVNLQKGFVLYVPVFVSSSTPQLVSKRRRKLAGFLFSPFRGGDYFRGMFVKGRVPDEDFDFAVFDGTEAHAGNLLFDFGAKRSFESRSQYAYSRLVPLEIAGQRWTLAFTANRLWSPWPHFGTPSGVLLVGGILSILVFELMRLVKRHSDRLRESEEAYRVTAETATDAILIIDADSTIHYANRAAEHTFGYGVDELVGRSLTMLMPESMRTAHLKGLKRFMATGRPTFSWERVLLPGRRKDGTEIFLEIAFGKFERHGKHLFSGIIRDVTDRKEAEQRLKKSEESLRSHAEELARSNAELARFAYVASHDLKEPLRVVTNYVQLLEKIYHDKLDAQAKEFIAVTVQATRRMYRLIDDLLAFSKIGASTDNRARQEMESAEIVNEALWNLDDRIKANGVEIVLGCLPKIQVDRTQVVQVFQNVIGNAIKYRSSDPPKVHVKAELREGRYLFSVTDNGIGIDREHFDKIFTIFQRLHNKDEYSGTGIGLAVCKKVVELHGGKIWVESTPGRGSTFYFTLPAPAAAELADTFMREPCSSPEEPRARRS